MNPALITAGASAGSTVAAGSGISLGEGLILFASFTFAASGIIFAIVVPVQVLG
jgi:hypothetical protein